MLGFCNALAKEHEVTVLADSRSLVSSENFEIEGVASSPIPYLDQLMFNIAVSAAVKRRAQTADLVYTRSATGLFGPSLALGRRNLAHVVELNGIRSDEMRAAGAPAWQRTVALKAEGRLFRSAHHFVVVTDAIGDYLRRSYGVPAGRITVVPNAVDIEMYGSLDKQTARARLGLPSGGVLVGFLGSLESWQGLEDLVGAASKIEGDVVVGGDGPMRRSLERSAQGAVRFVGQVSREDAPAFLSAMDVLVLTKRTLRSGFSPLKLYSYMASARPIVASRVAGMELLEQAGAGVLVAPGEPDELAEAVNGLTAHPGDRGQRGREVIERGHTWDHRVSQLLPVLEAVLRERSGPVGR